jgi:hypothetical protein
MAGKKANEITSRRLSDEETASMNVDEKVAMILAIKKAFKGDGPDGYIKVGEGQEFGEWDNETDAVNWAKRWVGDAYREMKWGKEKGKTKTGKERTLPPVVVEPRQRDGKFYVWIKRIRE